MTRVLVLVSPPHHLGLDEAEDWLRREIAPVTSGPGVRSAALSRLADASREWTTDWGWVLELEFEHPAPVRGPLPRRIRQSAQSRGPYPRPARHRSDLSA